MASLAWSASRAWVSDWTRKPRPGMRRRRYETPHTVGIAGRRDNRPRPGADAAQPAHPGCLWLRTASHAIERHAAGLDGVSRHRLKAAGHGPEGLRRHAARESGPDRPTVRV